MVHEAGCRQLKSLREKFEVSSISWDKSADGKHYPVSIAIASLNRAGLMYEVLGVLAARHINLSGGHFEIAPSAAAGFDQPAVTQILIEVENTAGLEDALGEIRKIADVISVSRIHGQELPDAGKGEPGELPEGGTKRERAAARAMARLAKKGKSLKPEQPVAGEGGRFPSAPLIKPVPIPDEIISDGRDEYADLIPEEE